MKVSIWLSSFILFPISVIAEPFYFDEAHTARPKPQDWMDKTDFSLLLVDYGIFALILVGLGWLLFKRPHYFMQCESVILRPFYAIFAAADRTGGAVKFILWFFGGLLSVVTLLAWVFFCQWLKALGLGAFSMAGMALMAIMVVRIVRGKPQSVI